MNGPSAVAAEIHAPAANAVMAAYRRSISAGSPNLAPKVARTHAATPVMPRMTAHQCGRAACSHQAAHHDAHGDAEGRELGAVAPCPPQQHDAYGLGERLAAVDDHHRLEAAPSRLTGLPAHPAVCGHARLREAAGRRLRRVQLVPEVPHRVWLAVGVRGERGAHRGEQVGAVKPRVLAVRRKAG